MLFVTIPKNKHVQDCTICVFHSAWFIEKFVL